MLQVIKFIGLLTMLSSYPNPETLNKEEIYCIARAVYHEARGETIAGQMAVAHTVLNRVESKRYPSTVCGVVYQPLQFTNLFRASKIDKTEDNWRLAWEQAVEIAGFSYIGFIEDPTNGATHYYSQTKLKEPPKWPSWIVKIATIGNHTFMKGNY